MWSILEGILKEICDFYEKFTCLTLFAVFILYFLITTQDQLSAQSEQAPTQKLLFSNKHLRSLIVHLQYWLKEIAISERKRSCISFLWYLHDLKLWNLKIFRNKCIYYMNRYWILPCQSFSKWNRLVTIAVYCVSLPYHYERYIKITPILHVCRKAFCTFLHWSLYIAWDFLFKWECYCNKTEFQNNDAIFSLVFLYKIILFSLSCLFGGFPVTYVFWNLVNYINLIFIFIISIEKATRKWSNLTIN